MLAFPRRVSDRECFPWGTLGHSLSQLRKKTGRQGGGRRTAGLPGGNVLSRCRGDEASVGERRKAGTLSCSGG